MRSLGVKHDILALQEDVAEDVDADSTAALETTEARAPLLLEVDQGARDDGIVAVNSEGQVWERSIAGEGVAAGAGIVLSTRDVAIVVVHDVVGEKKESGASV